MNWTLKSALILIAVILFLVAAIGLKVDVNVVPLGLAAFAAAFIVPDRGLRRR